MAKPKVWIFTPLRHLDHDGPMTLEVFETLAPHHKEPLRELLAQQDKLPWDIELYITGGGGVASARNRVTTEFMAQGGIPEDRILMKDYDLMPSAQDYVNLLCHDISIVGGLYTVRADNGHWVLNRFSGAMPNDNGILPVMELGTGFKCFKRSALDKVLKDNPWLDCESDYDHKKRTYGFFSMGPVHDPKHWPGKHRWLTEDYWLDWLCRESGFAIAVDTKIKLRHKDDFSGKIYPAQFPADPGRLPAEMAEL